MLCPVCKGRTQVLETRRGKFKVWRSRYCPKCGNRFATEEQLTAGTAKETIGYRQSRKDKPHD